MIYYVKGDITTSNCDIICHQVNCQGAMNSGVAKAIREKWPEVYVNYKFWCDREEYKEDLLGQKQAIFINDNPQQLVVNLYTQLYYGYNGHRYTNYEAFYNAINEVAKEFVAAYNKTIAFPYKIGCVRGGANWNIIRTMIEEVFEDRDIYFYYLNDEDLEFFDKMLIKEMTLEEIKEGLGINV